MPPCRPAALRRSRCRRVVANAVAGATPTASSPAARPTRSSSAAAGTRRRSKTGGRARGWPAAVGTRPCWRRPLPAATRAQLGHEAGVGQQPQRPHLRDVDDHRVLTTRADVGHDAVTADVGVLHQALVTVDAEDLVVGFAHGWLLRLGRQGPLGLDPATNVRRGYDNEGRPPPMGGGRPAQRRARTATSWADWSVFAPNRRAPSRTRLSLDTTTTGRADGNWATRS